MEEATVEEVADAEELEAEASLDGAIERDSDTRELQSRSRKPSVSKANSLDELVSKEDITLAIDEDGKIIPVYKGNKVNGEGSSMPANFIRKGMYKPQSREAHDSSDGAHAIIYHRDPETGKIYLVFEKKPASYPYPEAVGKLSLYGGAIRIGESPNDGVVRELKEEDPDSSKMLIKAMNETGFKVAEINQHIDGVPSTIHVWAAEIKDPGEWKKYLSSKSTEGDKAVKSLEEITAMKNSYFAFSFGPVVRGFANIVNEHYSKIYGYSQAYKSYSSNTIPSILLGLN